MLPAPPVAGSGNTAPTAVRAPVDAAKAGTHGLFRHAEFVISVADPRRMPPASGPEIAFAGRSNAGKSSAINALAGHTRLAYVSKTPGRTQLLNLFRLKCGATLVDLPGYGYADVPEAVRRQWADMIEGYLTRREELAGLVLIVDARRGLTDLDRQLIAWFTPSGRPIHCLLTKADKLARQHQCTMLRAALDELRTIAPWVSAQLFSSLKKTGIDEVERTVGSWLTALRAPAQDEPGCGA